MTALCSALSCRQRAGLGREIIRLPRAARRVLAIVPLGSIQSDESSTPQSGPRYQLAFSYQGAPKCWIMHAKPIA